MYWDSFPPEIRNQIVGLLPATGERCSVLATVCREWRSTIEPLNFAEISLTLPRLAESNSQDLLFRKRSLIRYIWFRVELKPYDCGECANNDRDHWALDEVDNQFIADSFESLFKTLSTWESVHNLVLDISIYSPSDNRHWFKYLSFCSDTDPGPAESLLSGYDRGTPLMNDGMHGWAGGRRVHAPEYSAIEQTFKEIMAEGPFDDEEPEMQWWRSLPSVPAVRTVLLRQQTRRRWKPVALANMLTRFPRLKELCYEPWREWGGIQLHTDKRTRTLIESFAGATIRKLTIFENFNESYPEIYRDGPAIRAPNPSVSQELARASLDLTDLSASFMAEAKFFFAARQDSWTWHNLTSLALTSRLLTHEAEMSDINNMLRDAATAALWMPSLHTMELWNARRGTAMLFRYQRTRDGRSAVLTIRGTSELALGSSTMQAWENTARQHQHGKVAVLTSLIEPGLIRCHGDAIRQLGLSTQVVRPVSLRQILREDRFRV